MAATQDNIEFEKLLNALSSQDAAVRKEAELGFRKLPLQEKVQHLLCNIFDDEQTADMREFNALLLSRCFVSSTAAVRRQITAVDASEAVSRIALAVDRDSLMGDGSTGEQIMQRVMQTHDDEQTEYVLDLLAHIAMICGKQFEQFLPLVMGPVLDKSQHALLSGCDELEEAACEMLLYCFGELKQHYPQQVEHAMQLLLPALKFYFHDYLGPKLINAISVDPARDVQSELLHTLSQCLALLPPRSLDEQTLQQLLAIVQRFLLAHWQPKLQLCLTDAQYSSEDECSMRGTDSISSLELGDEMNDALDAELQAANEEQVDFDIMPKLIGILHALFGLYKEQFLPHFQQLAPQLLKLLEPARPYPLRCWGLSIFNDLIEHCGTACGKYSEILVAALLQNMQEHEPETSKQAICGCALLAQHGGNQFASAFVLFVPQLMAIVMQPDAQNEANLHITEPAIAAFTQILKHNNKDLGNLDELIAAWFSWLPISKDAKCAQIAYDYMCELFQAQHPQILGEHNFNFPYIVTLIAYAFQLQLILPHSPSGRRMLQVVQQIESDAQAVQRISLSQKQQEALQLAKQQLQVDGVANSLKKI
ncbi:importin-5-like [Drosophila busckii]|uniref:importin-5-like n=1 Tax=Drosophila busckii TaxID=30019 RepID=UPI0014330BBC|nr:importin-5-like [Drosophila busckii]